MSNVTINTTAHDLQGIFNSFSHHTLVIIASIIVLVAVFTVASNVIVLIALVRSRRSDNSNAISGSGDNGITKMMMTSMAVVDMFIGALLTPLFSLDVINKGQWYLGGTLCTARQSVNNLLCSVLVFNILFMSLDKYMAICKPMSYRVLTPRHGYAMVVLSWSIPVVIFTVLDSSGLSHVGVAEALEKFDKMRLCAQAFNKPVLFTMTVTTILIPYSICAIAYVLVLREIRRFHSRNPRNKSSKAFVKFTDLVVKSQTISSCSSPFVVSNDYVICDTSLNTNEDVIFTSTCGNMMNTKDDTKITHFYSKKNTSVTPRPDQTIRSRPSNRNIKAYKTIGGIFFCFNLCWVPSWIFVIIFVYDGFTSSFWPLVVFLFLTYTNAAINPFIYCSIRSVRLEVRTLLCRTH